VFKKFAIGCSTFLFALLVTSYTLLMHTSLPLRYIASKIPQDESVRIGEVGGSIYGGPTLESLRIDLNDNDFIEMEDLAFKYRSIWDFFGGEEIVIHEIRVGKATVDIESQPSKDEPEDEAQRPTSSSKTDDRESRRSTQSGPDLVIHKIDISNIVFVHQEYEIKKFEVDDAIFRKDESSLKRVEVKSSYVDFYFQESTREPLLPDTRVQLDLYTSSMRPNEQEASPIDLKGTLAFGESGDVRAELSSFDEALNFEFEAKENTDETMTFPVVLFKFRDFTPGKYFQGVPLRNLTVEYDCSNPDPSEIEDPGKIDATVSGGRFELGETSFTIPPAKYSDAKFGDIIGLATVDEREIECKVSLSGREPYMQLSLSGAPSAAQETVAAEVFFRTSPEQLSKTQKEQLGHLMENYLVGP
jgi:hypothetical protein